MGIEEDLRWLKDECFSCSIGLNEDRPSFASVQQMVADGEIEDEDWVSLEAKAACIADDSLVSIQVYPCGSVSFYKVYGHDLGETLASARAHAAVDLERWAKNDMLPMHKRTA